jgi:excisionase family DNA binding protein
VYIGVDVALFDRLVAEGRMPEPRAIYGRLIWDATEIAHAFRQLPHRAPGGDTGATARNAVKPAEGRPGYANVYTPSTLAKRWECSPATIYNMIERGNLAAFKVGGKLLRIKAEDVEAFEQLGGLPGETESTESHGTKSERAEDDTGTATNSEPATAPKLPALRRLDTPSLRARWARESATCGTRTP